MPSDVYLIYILLKGSTSIILAANTLASSLISTSSLTGLYLLFYENIVQYYREALAPSIFTDSRKGVKI